MLANIERIAGALERLANAVEHSVYGVTGAELRQVKQLLEEDEKAS